MYQEDFKKFHRKQDLKYSVIFLKNLFIKMQLKTKNVCVGAFFEFCWEISYLNMEWKALLENQKNFFRINLYVHGEAWVRPTRFLNRYY